MPLEIVSISVVLVAILLLVLVTTYTKNLETMQFIEANENGVQCSEISTAISRLYSNSATIKEKLDFAAETEIRRITSPGGIEVGNVICSYVGSVEYYNSGSPIYDTDPSGITLPIGTWCFEKSNGEVVIKEESACD